MSMKTLLSSNLPLLLNTYMIA